MHKTRISAFALALLLTYATPMLVNKAGADQMPVSSTPTKLVGAPAIPNIITLRITAYSSSIDQTDDTPFITASGERVRDGIVATNRRPLGTKVMIPSLFGDKVFVVEDRMNIRFQKSMDIWMPTRGKAIFFGVHYADVVVLNSDDDGALTLK